MYFEDFITLLKFAAVTALCIFGIHSCTTSSWWQAHEAAEAASNAAEAKPHVIRATEDGCKVYAWRDNGGVGEIHYFTRCGSTVTTERNYTVSHGKTSEHKTETIVTQGNS
ncbi:hypothetical protein [Burkholderia vietnamiensis]|uniref:hypothetical protein n=1 Tax=Burkholderia vietnamiensis TaxID=60552 RepID=UPI00264EB9D8|nr:hypothetical protein [Burkholderia vietnamiensis]MDN8037423.1 hypothetical protein [Burkholderia vietnamiensis]